MNRVVVQLLLLCCAAAVSGCAMTGGRTAATGRLAFASLQAATAEAAENVKGTVVLVKLKGPAMAGDPSIVISGNGRIRSNEQSGERTMTGLIMTTNGYAVVAESVNPGDVTRAEAWIGDTEYRASVVKTDPQLGMTILKIEVDGPVKVLDITNADDLQPGEWCVAVQPTDEALEYQSLISLAICRGQSAGLYREFLLDCSQPLRPGTPVLGLSGNVVGLVQRRGSVLSMNDIHDDLLALLEEAAGVKSADEEAKKKAWFGAMLSAINKDYARKYGLSKSYLWVHHVVEGSSAYSAGLRPGDLVARVNGRDMRLTDQRAREFFNKALRPKVGQPFRVTVLRDGKMVDLEGVFTKEPEPETVMATDLGVTVKRIEGSDVVSRNLFTSEGVLVVDVKRGSAASVGSNMRSGLLNAGDVITAVGGTPTPDLATFSAVLEALRREQKQILLVAYRRGRTTGLAALNLKIGENDTERGNRK